MVGVGAVAGLTVRVMDPLTVGASLEVAVMVTSPSAMPRTTPAAETVALASSEEDQVTASLAFSGVTVTDSVRLPPLRLLCWKP